MLLFVLACLGGMLMIGIAPRTLNAWGLVGNWSVDAKQAGLNDKDGGIVHRSKARDLHLALGDGGTGVVTAQRLYQRVREARSGERTFEIRFLDAGVQAYAFTFG